MRKLQTFVLTLSATALASTAAQAQLVVIGQGQAAICYQKASLGDQGSTSSIQTCTNALKQPNSTKDIAATYVNRGILHMRKGDQVKAAADYREALERMPQLTEAHINLAASLIRQEKFEEAIVSLNTALEDEAQQRRPEALYNRAIARDWLGDYRGAYFDLKAALKIKPDWKPALDLISGYDVKPAG